MLVMLLLDAGRVVDVERLVAGQYGDSPPAGDSTMNGLPPASSERATSPSVIAEAIHTASRWEARPVSAVTSPPPPRDTLPSSWKVTGPRFDTRTSVLRSGAGIKGGQTYGETTDDGRDVKTDPGTEGDLFATIYTALGVNPRARHQVGVRPIWATPEGSKPL